MPKSSPMVHEARLLGILDTAADGIIVINAKADILVFNKACEAMFGYAASDVLGKNISLLMPSDFSVDHDRYVSHYLETGERRIIGIGREVRGKHADGTVFPLELSVGEAQTPDGRQFIGVIRDVRSRKAVEQRLNQLQAQLVNMARVQAIDEMGAAIAHELNQPLTAVMLYLQAVIRKTSSDTASQLAPQTLEILNKALREAERAGGIIQRMRHSVERREPERQACDLNALIDEALELVLLGHDIEGLHIVRDLDPMLTHVHVDPIPIQQVLANLLRNAMEAVRKSDRRMIKIQSMVSGGQAIVNIEDSGPGIPPDGLSNLFKAFATTKKSGLGLGLMISRSIAQNHGGDLTVDGGGDGRGATFSLRLPLIVGSHEQGIADQ